MEHNLIILPDSTAPERNLKYKLKRRRIFGCIMVLQVLYAGQWHFVADGTSGRYLLQCVPSSGLWRGLRGMATRKHNVWIRQRKEHLTAGLGTATAQQ